MTIQISKGRPPAKSPKTVAPKLKPMRSTIHGSDVYEDGKRVTGGPTVFERLKAIEAAAKSRK